MAEKTFDGRLEPSNASSTSTRNWLIYGLIAVILLILSIVFLNLENPLAVFSTFTTRFLGIFIEAIPFLLLGSLVSGLIEVFVSRDALVAFVPQNRYLAAVGGTFLGMVFPVCECGVVPVARRLFKKGLPVSVGVAFLLAAPFMNPIVFASTFIAFGFGEIFIGRFLITAVIASTVGLLFAAFAKPEAVFQEEVLGEHLRSKMTELREGQTTASKKVQLIPGIIDASRHATDEVLEMGRYLIIGCLLAAAMQTLVPQEMLLSIGSGPIISVLTMQILAFVLSVCSTVDAFLALAFVNTFTTGSLLAFLSFGPMVDIKSTMMFLGVFKRPVVAFLIAMPFIMSLIIGILINLIL